MAVVEQVVEAVPAHAGSIVVVYECAECAATWADRRPTSPEEQ